MKLPILFWSIFPAVEMKRLNTFLMRVWLPRPARSEESERQTDRQTDRRRPTDADRPTNSQTSKFLHGFKALSTSPVWSNGSVLHCGWEVSGSRPGRSRALFSTWCYPGLVPFSINGSKAMGGFFSGFTIRNVSPTRMRGRLGGWEGGSRQHKTIQWHHLNWHVINICPVRLAKCLNT